MCKRATAIPGPADRNTCPRASSAASAAISTPPRRSGISSRPTRGPERPRLQRFGRLQHVGDVAGDLHLAPEAADHALAIDQEGGALQAHILAAVHTLLDPGAVGLGGLAVGIAGEHEGQGVLLLELVVAGDAVARHADDGGVDAAEILHVVTEVAGLLGAAGGIVLR